MLVLVRHGQSTWNLENRFTGETDVPLTELGREQARAAGIRLRTIGFVQGFTSELQRAIDTMSLILEEALQPQLPVTRNRALNERNYGRLQGLNKRDVAATYGDAQVDDSASESCCTPSGRDESLADTAGPGAALLPIRNPTPA